MIALQAHCFAQPQGAAATKNLMEMMHTSVVGSASAALLFCDAAEYKHQNKS